MDGEGTSLNGGCLDLASIAKYSGRVADRPIAAFGLFLLEILSMFINQSASPMVCEKDQLLISWFPGFMYPTSWQLVGGSGVQDLM